MEQTTKKLKILVMDDEELIRQILGETLRMLGYEVIVTSDGEEALEKYVEAMSGGKPFDLVILDLTVPNGMGGKETLDRLFEINKDVIAFVSSGFSLDVPEGFRLAVPKPYRLEQVARAIKEVFE